MNLRRRNRRLVGINGIDFVRCRICGARRRVISGKHLSMHDIDRESYMEEFRLSPDELIAKVFRALQSSRKGYTLTTSANGLPRSRMSIKSRGMSRRDTYNTTTL